MEIKNVMEFCVKHNIHINQFMVLYLNNGRKSDSEILSKYIKKFSYDGKMTGMDTNDLLEKGFIEEKDDTYLVTQKFRSLFTNDDSFEEVFDRYPAFVKTDKGVPLTLKGSDKYELSKKYHAIVLNSLEEHNELLKDIDYGLQNNLINYKIDMFFAVYYKELRKLRLNNVTMQVYSQDL